MLWVVSENWWEYIFTFNTFFLRLLQKDVAFLVYKNTLSSVVKRSNFLEQYCDVWNWLWDWRTGAQYQNEVYPPYNVLGFVEATYRHTVVVPTNNDLIQRRKTKFHSLSNHHLTEKADTLTKCPLSQSRY